MPQTPIFSSGQLLKPLNRERVPSYYGWHDRRYLFRVADDAVAPGGKCCRPSLITASQDWAVYLEVFWLACISKKLSANYKFSCWQPCADFRLATLEELQNYLAPVLDQCDRATSPTTTVSAILPTPKG